MVNDAQIVFRDFRSERLQAPNGAFTQCSPTCVAVFKKRSKN
jgi:hypothetical protein